MKATIRLSLCLAIVLTSGPLCGQESQKNARAARPQSYGIDQVSYYRMAASEFGPVATAGGLLYNDEFYGNGSFQRYTSPYPGQFLASPHLPSGAVLTYFELDSCDTDPVNDVVARLYPCDDLGTCGSPVQLNSSNNAVACGYTSADVSASGIQVDNYRNQITILIDTSGSESARFAGVILGYKLQVSPAPQFADFDDVPTSSPQFQFVEALFASGITAGCGSGNYCPNAPLTRGQMAVFLAKALGLQWP